MKIRNHTRWQTADLGAIARRVARLELEPDRRGRYTVVVKYNRGGDRHGYTSGRATVPGLSCVLMVPSGHVDPVDFACTCAHEMAHSRGLHHAQMRGALRPRAAKAQPSTEAKREKALEHALVMAKRWEARVKRGNTSLKKWRRRVREIQARITAAAAIAANQPGGPHGK